MQKEVDERPRGSTWKARVTAKGVEDTSGLLRPNESKGKGRLSELSLNRKLNTQGLEFKLGMAESAKSEYHNLVGHHEPHWEGHENQGDAVASMNWSQQQVFLLIHHWFFEAFAAGVIVCNACVMGVAAEIAIQHNKEHPNDKNGVTSAFVDAMGYVFFAFYSVELLLRAFALRLRFFSGGDRIWNCLDLVLVLTAIYDIIEKEVGIGFLSGSNTTFFRLLRLLKMVKMLRVFRVMKFFRELRVMMYAIVGSMRLLFWAMLMLALITYMFSLVFLQGVNQYLASDFVDAEVRSEALLYWGSVGTSMVTLYEAISGGNDWSPLAAPLKHCGDSYYYLFLFYIAFLTFTVLNVLTGVVVDAALMIAELDGGNVSDEFMCNQLNDHERINELVNSIELNGDGFIAWDELVSGREKDNIRTFFANMDIDIEEVEGFYRLMQCAGKEAKVKTADFIKGCGNLKLWGSSKSIESFLLMRDLSRLKKMVNASNQRILACFAQQGIDVPLADDEGSDDEVFNLTNDFADPGNAPDPLVSQENVAAGSWAQLVDKCTDLALLTSLSGRVAERIEVLNRPATSQKFPWQKNKKNKAANPAGQHDFGAAETDVPEESVTKLASLIVKEAMPQLMQEVEKIMRTDGGVPSAPEPKMYGAKRASNAEPSSPIEAKDAGDAPQGDTTVQTKAWKKKKGFKAERKSNLKDHSF